MLYCIQAVYQDVLCIWNQFSRSYHKYFLYFCSNTTAVTSPVSASAERTASKNKPTRRFERPTLRLGVQLCTSLWLFNGHSISPEVLVCKGLPGISFLLFFSIFSCFFVWFHWSVSQIVGNSKFQTRCLSNTIAQIRHCMKESSANVYLHHFSLCKKQLSTKHLSGILKERDSIIPPAPFYKATLHDNLIFNF